jgi:RimJ/RimL family protein N-acetyltransferase
MHILETRRLILRPFAPQDAAAITAELNDMEMCRGLAVVPCPYTLDDADWFIREAAQDALAVCTKDNILIGAVGLGTTLGYWIAKSQWRKGYAFEACHAVLTDHFSRRHKDVHSGYVDDNYGSAAVLRKLGFDVVKDTMLHIRSRAAEMPAKAVVLRQSRWDMVK